MLVEAMHCGLPVVSTDCLTGPRAILGSGAYGILVPMDDEAALAAALEQGLRAPADRELLITRASQLSGRHVSARYLALMLGQ